MKDIEEDKKIEFVYKYQAINCNSKDALTNNYLYFPKPSQINDPFDCRIAAIYKGSQEELEKWLVKQSVDNTIKNSVRETFKRQGCLILPQENLNDIADKKLQFCSLAQAPDNILLWSHYANNHTGICLKIKVEFQNVNNGVEFNSTNFKYSLAPDAEQGFLPLLRVNYSNEVPETVNLLQPDLSPNWLNDFIRTKGALWQYENEMRLLVNSGYLVKDDNDKQKVKYDPKRIIDGIIFGVMTKDEDKDEIKKIARKKLYPEIKFYQATQNEGKYELNIDLID